MLDDTLIDASTVHINKVGDVYKAGYSDFNVKFCGIDISFSQKILTKRSQHHFYSF